MSTLNTLLGITAFGCTNLFLAHFDSSIRIFKQQFYAGHRHLLEKRNKISVPKETTGSVVILVPICIRKAHWQPFTLNLLKDRPPSNPE